MAVQKISSKELFALIKEEAEKIKQELQEGNITKVGDPVEDVDLNKNDGTGDSDKALVYKDKSGKEEKGGKKSSEDPMDVKLNQQPSKGGSDEKASTAVGVKAGSEKGGNNVTTGQRKANFESKTDGPKNSVSDPFLKKTGEKMNKEDKVVDEGTKTFVEAGAEKSGTDVTAGQHKAGWKENAPKSDNDKRIANGIQLKESYSKAELATFILSEAKKLAKKQMLEQELLKIKEEIANIK